MAKETWTTVALPILERVSAGETDDPRAATANVLQGVNEHKANLFALASLIDDGYLGGVGVFRPLGRGEPIVTADVLFLTPKGRRAVGQWPTGESGELLIRSLEAA